MVHLEYRPAVRPRRPVLGPGRIFVLLAAALAGGLRPPAAGGHPQGGELVRGVTISCQTWGREWGTDGFARELDDLATLGVNWVAIHPYARIEADGTVRWRAFDPEQPPAWLARPIAEAHRRGMAILIKPHLACWGSPFSWPGEVDFEGAELERFFTTYRGWIVALARATRGADAFVVGTETDRLVAHEGPWRALVAAVRAVTDAKLTYAANHTDFERVPFWDALDAVGVQGYFPLAAGDDPSPPELELGWRAAIERLRAVHERTGKPVVLTELGYDRSLAAAREPWAFSHPRAALRADDVPRAEALQVHCFEAALRALEDERSWLRGAFLWKWFVGEPGRGEDFVVDAPAIRALLARHWAGS